MMVDQELIEELKRIIRVKSQDSELELIGLVESCRKELELAGVYGTETDPTYRQAVRLYCKGHYGYDENTERFQEAFSSLRDAMKLSGEYEKEGGVGGRISLDNQDEG